MERLVRSSRDAWVSDSTNLQAATTLKIKEQVMLIGIHSGTAFLQERAQFQPRHCGPFLWRIVEGDWECDAGEITQLHYVQIVAHIVVER
jgi:hypothetical protein